MGFLPLYSVCCISVFPWSRLRGSSRYVFFSEHEIKDIAGSLPFMWINLNQWAGVAAFKPLSPGLTKIWVKMSTYNVTGTDRTNGEASLCHRNRAEIIVFMWGTESLPTLRAVVSQRPAWRNHCSQGIPTRCGVNTESVAKPSCCCCFLSNYIVGVLFVYFDYMLEFQPVLSRISIGLCHAFSYLYVSSLQLIFKNNGPVLLLKTIFRHWTDSCYGSLAVSGQDGHWSKL